MNMDRLITLFRLECPTSSATRARVWFELRSGGLRVIAIGLGVALLIYILFAMGIPYVLFRPFAIISVLGGAPAALVLFTRNAFGIRRKQKREFLSAFEATQPCGTAQLAGAKLLVRTACVLIAMLAIVGSAWKSSSLVSEWGPWKAGASQETNLNLLNTRSALGEDFFGAEGYEFAANVVDPLIFVILLVSGLAALSALDARYPRRLRVVGSLLLLFILALQTGRGFLPQAIYSAMPWIVVAAMLFTTGYFLWSGFKERALTTGFLCGALVISAANALACLPGSFSSILGTALLPLMICVLALWALSRIRHT